MLGLQVDELVAVPIVETETVTVMVAMAMRLMTAAEYLPTYPPIYLPTHR
jgi:hypothetical protein